MVNAVEGFQRDISFVGGSQRELQLACVFSLDVAMARRNGDTWYVAVINGSDEPRSVELDWSRVKTKAKVGAMFADSGNADNPWNLSATASLPSKVDLQPRGGYVMVIPTK